MLVKTPLLLLFGCPVLTSALSGSRPPRAKSHSKLLVEPSVEVEHHRITETAGVPRRLWLQQAAFGALSASVVVAQPELAIATGETESKNGVYIPPPHSMDGKLVLITGGNTGLGLESAKRLAAAGADIIVTVRNEAKGKQAVQEIEQYAQDILGSTPNVRYSLLDLASLQSVDDFSKRLPKVLASNDGVKSNQIDVLINNAGIMAIPDRQLTVDGLERTFQTNHLGHFALTAKLIPLLAPKAKIINVSSEAYQFAPKGLEVDNLQGEREYGPWSSYGQSKLANILFTKELQKRASEKGKEWTITALHPGAVATDLGRYLVGEEKWNDMKQNGMSWQDALLFVPLSKLTKTVEQGASTQVYLAANDGVGGHYYMNAADRESSLSGYPNDPKAMEALWTLSEDLSKTKFNF